MNEDDRDDRGEVDRFFAGCLIAIGLALCFWACFYLAVRLIA